MNNETYNKKYVYLLTASAALGGLLFGYDTAVISGAIGFLQTKFVLSAAMKGWAASSAIIGCIIGAMIAGTLSGRFGRKKILILTAVLFGVSAVGSALPETLSVFVAARLIGGIGVGAASMLSPLYITELAPAKIRGQLVSLYQLAIVLGILIIFFVNLMIQNMGDESWNVNLGWRYMFGSETIPAVLFLIAMFFVPESPRWLTKEGRDDEALDVLNKINGPEKAKSILAEIKESLKEEEGTLRELFVGKFRPAIIVGIVLAIFSQVQGINAIMYYAPEIFKEIGETANSAFFQTLIIGVINTLFTFVAIGMVDKWGRKSLLLYGGLGMFISLVAVGAAFYFQMKGMGLLFFILCYIACFAFSFGPITWVVISEIFPTKMRGVAMSVATFSLWVAVYLVTQLFPILLERIGPAFTFWVFAAMAFLGMLFTYNKVPETKGKTLEEIEQAW
ncbi:MAG: arabinose-proton symporter [Saprospiraceae bacterium]|nr:MAG: arabinose-proton symporter [Saprospiraceae bacterium]